MNHISVIFSNENIDISAGTNLEYFLKLQGMEYEHIATAVNNEFVAKDERIKFVLKQGDKISVFGPITGG